jgi:predicted double-glycine peptidase
MTTMRMTVWLTLATLLPAPAAWAIDLASVGGGRMVVPLKTWKQARFAATVHQQYDFSCGSAALATLLTHHYNSPVTEQVIFEQMYATGDQQKIRKQGFSLLDMQRFLATRGFRGDGFQLPLEKLIEAKLPAIVLVSDNGYNHFVVIKGVAEGRILVGDPSKGARAIPLQQFRDIWVNKLLFVIHGYPGQVAFNLPADWQAAPLAPLAQALLPGSLDLITLPKFGPGDF